MSLEERFCSSLMWNQADHPRSAHWVSFHGGFSSLSSGVISEAIGHAGAAVNHLCQPGRRWYRLIPMWWMFELLIQVHWGERTQLTVQQSSFRNRTQLVPDLWDDGWLAAFVRGAAKYFGFMVGPIIVLCTWSKLPQGSVCLSCHCCLLGSGPVKQLETILIVTNAINMN